MLPIYTEYTHHLAVLEEYVSRSLLSEDALLETICQDVRLRGDEALISYSHQFDKIDPHTFSMTVSQEDIQTAYDLLEPSVIEALRVAYRNIVGFHQHQLPTNWTDSPAPGVQYGMVYHPIDRVGLYVPGGRAVYPSSVLMNAIPAQLAGVPTRVMVTPPQPNGSVHPALLVAAHLCGISHIFKVGGAQAIFALAYGTSTIPAVDKIVGPGNTYVTLAKKKVFGHVAIDKPAGPSEVIVYCDTVAYATFAASELLAQLEHDPDAIAIAVCTSQAIVSAIQDAFVHQLDYCTRKDIICQSVMQSGIWLVSSEEIAINAINEVACEHVVLLSERASLLVDHIRHGASIFVGPYSPVALGDYVAGPNHVLPTNRGARFASPLGVMDFMTFSSVLEYSKEALEKVAPTIKVLSKVEGLDAHFQSVSQRLG